MMKRVFSVMLAVLLGTVAVAQSLLSTGEGVFTYEGTGAFADRSVDVHYYIPEGCASDTARAIFVFHGADRGWETLMDAWGEAARANRFMVFIPHFTKEKFPLAYYQEAGVMGKGGSGLMPRATITPVLIDSIFAFVRLHVAECPGSYSIYGHSAGGQFVQRYLLFNDSPWLDRAVIGSPGWYTFPDRAALYPYGIGNVPYATDGGLRRMFARDVTVQLAEADTVREWYLRKTPEADAQGRNRLERGVAFYDSCRSLCVRNGWDFRWRLMVVPHVGHHSVDMGMAALPVLLQPSPRAATPTLSLADTARFATSAEIGEWVDRLVAAHPDMACKEVVGQTPGGRDVSLLTLGRKGVGVKVWLQGGLHGNEPAAPEVVCHVASWLLGSEEGRALLDRVQVAVLPVANPDGYDHGNRLSGDGIDLNRDQSKAEDAMTALLKKAWISFAPDLSVDVHEFNPLRKDMRRLNGHTLETDYDLLMLPSGHPNINVGLRDVAWRMLAPAVETSLKKRGYKPGVYFTPKFVGDSLYLNWAARSPQSSSTWCGLADAVSFFVEIKGIGYGRRLLEKRVDCGFTAVREVLRQVALHRNEVVSRVGNARMTTLADTARVTVTFVPDTVRRMVDFYDVDAGRRVTVWASALDAMSVKPAIVRDRPAGYELEASCGTAVARLEALGFKVDRLPGKGKYRYFVPTAQPRGNLFVTIMEPESHNGLVYFNVIRQRKDGRLPYRRVER